MWLKIIHRFGSNDPIYFTANNRDDQGLFFFPLKKHSPDFTRILVSYRNAWIPLFQGCFQVSKSTSCMITFATEIWRYIENEKGIYRNRKEGLTIKEAECSSGERNSAPVGVAKVLGEMNKFLESLSFHPLGLLFGTLWLAFQMWRAIIVTIRVDRICVWSIENFL